MWEPISLNELNEEIDSAEVLLTPSLKSFWDLIKIVPEKWQESKYGTEGNGFWVVALIGHQIIWYNDIEDGFNISPYEVYGQIKEYWCNQYLLNELLCNITSTSGKGD